MIKRLNYLGDIKMINSTHRALKCIKQKSSQLKREIDNCKNHVGNVNNNVLVINRKIRQKFSENRDNLNNKFNILT